MAKRGRKATGDDELFATMFASPYAGPDAAPADGDRKRVMYETLWLNGKPGTVATYKSGLRQWAAWCQSQDMTLEAHPDMKVWLYLKHVVDSRAPGATTNLVSGLEGALKGLNLLRKCQPGVPEPYNLTTNELIAALLKEARMHMQAMHESNTEIQCIHGTDRLTVAEQESIVDACDGHGVALGVQVRALVNVGVATGMRGDDLARRRFHQVWIDPEPLPWAPLPAHAISMSGRVSKGQRQPAHPVHVAAAAQERAAVRHGRAGREGGV